MRIMIVEDDHLQAGPFTEYLQDAFPEAEIETVPTEKDFRQRLASLSDSPPDVVVMDVMLRWDFPRKGAEPPPQDVLDGGHYYAGVRCAELMAGFPPLSDTPVVFCTIVDHDELVRGRTLPGNSRYVRKSADLDGLTKTIKAVCTTRADQPASRTQRS